MARAENILNELKELDSGLEAFGQEITYRIPANYFEALPSILIRRIKALDALNASEELALLSPYLSGIKKTNPYRVPVGYFDNVEDKIDWVMQDDPARSAAGELNALSPLLGSLKEKITYRAPEGYFEQVQNRPVGKSKASPAKVISLTGRKWFRMVAAAMVIGIVATAGLFLLNNNPRNINSSEKSYAWVQKNMKKVSTEEISKFVELASAASNDMAKNDSKDDISNLLKDVSDKEIQDFLKDTQGTDAETDDDLILN